MWKTRLLLKVLFYKDKTAQLPAGKGVLGNKDLKQEIVSLHNKFHSFAWNITGGVKWTSKREKIKNLFFLHKRPSDVHIYLVSLLPECKIADNTCIKLHEILF